MPKKLLTTLSLLLLLLTTPLGAQNSVESQKKVIAAIEKQIAEGEKAITSLRKDMTATQSKVTSLAAQVEQRNRLLEAQQTQLQLLQGEIESAAFRSTELSVELAREREAYGQMVREAYRNYRNNNFISYIFASENFKDIARRIVNIRRVAQLREQRMATIDSLSSDLDATRIILLDRKTALDATIVEITQQKSRIQRDITAARAEISSMSKKEKNALQAKALQQQKLSTAVEELRKLSKGNSKGASFNAKTSNLNLPVKNGRVKRYMDNMAEIVGAEGAAVISIYEGKVVDVKVNRITGKYEAYIAHGEYITSYAGLKSVSVAKGSSVAKNQVIGQVGAAVDIITMNTEYKIIFGIYPPSPTQKMKASDCFKK